MSKSNSLENDLLKHIFNNDATDLEGPAPEFMSADGAKARVSSTYAAGTRTVTDIDGT